MTNAELVTKTHMIDFLLKSIDRDSMVAMAIEQGFMDEEGNPMPGTDFDPTPGSPGLRGRHRHRAAGGDAGGTAPRLALQSAGQSGEKEQEQIEGIPQYDKGELLPLRQRTTFGIAMTQLGFPWTGENGTTTGVTANGVTFIDPESIASQQRVWQ